MKTISFERGRVMGAIQLSNIQKNFGATQVLKSIDLDVNEGEFLTLVGPSGCGKSTLLRIIAGLETQSLGEISIGKNDVSGVKPSERDLAMVFQSYALYPHLSVAENMMTPLRLRELGFAEQLPFFGSFIPGRNAKVKRLRTQVQSVAQILKIEHLLDRKPGQLSGGQRQRAALGRAMVRKPVAFLMDEPLSNLDAALRVHMRAELAELHRALKTTFIYVTHDQAEALTMSDRMAVMMDGDILQLDTPEAIYANPLDRRVAEFVGSPKINMLEGAMSATGEITAYGQTFMFKGNGDNQKIALGIRPEHLSIDLTAPSHGPSFPVSIIHKENLGSDIFIHATLEDGLRIVVRSHPEDANRLDIGTKAFIWPDTDQIMVFGSDNKRIPLIKEAPITLSNIPA